MLGDSGDIEADGEELVDALKVSEGDAEEVLELDADKIHAGTFSPDAARKVAEAVEVAKSVIDGDACKACSSWRAMRVLAGLVRSSVEPRA
jgi:hypothetical protein